MPSSIRKVNSSAVDSMKKNIKQVLRTSVKKIQGEMEEYSLYKHNYEFMMYSPIVQQLKQELALLNEEMNDLRNENKQLKRELKKVAKCESRIKKEKLSKKSNNAARATAFEN
jgi:small-conductance mechanosensitive channel